MNAMRCAAVTLLCLAGLSLGGCDTMQHMPGFNASATSSTQGSLTDPSALTPADAQNAAQADNQDEISRGKRQFRAGDYGLAEMHFRKAVEQYPNNVEAWIGLAAAYDRLRRFDLADRAYAQAIRIDGPTAAILNNRGYSYMLRGDYARARADLLKAQAKDPQNPYIKANLRTLAAQPNTRR